MLLWNGLTCVRLFVFMLNINLLPSALFCSLLRSKTTIYKQKHFSNVELALKVPHSTESEGPLHLSDCRHTHINDVLVRKAFLFAQPSDFSGIFPGVSLSEVVLGFLERLSME